MDSLPLSVLVRAAAAAAVLQALPAAAQAPAASPATPQARAAHAAPRPPATPHVQGPVLTGPIRLDQRYHHDHYYPAPGFTVQALPAGSVSIRWRDGSWFFHGGVWFRPAGSRFVVAVPPAGIVVPALPPAVVPLWIGSAAYYYGNGVYYSAVPEGFAVVAPPAGADAAQPVPSPPGYVIYPRFGQSAAQVEADRAACNQWAAAHPDAAGDPWLFQRAFEACMEARGYTLR